jgi:hypothetical protein
VILSSSDLHGNPNAIFISGVGKSMGRSIYSHAISFIYSIYKRDLFPKLLHNPNVQSDDKQKIRELLKKPWNPYIRYALSIWNTISNWQMMLAIIFFTGYFYF